MRQTLLMSSLALFLPLVGCGTIQVSGDAIASGQCTKLQTDPTTGRDPALLIYYQHAQDESSSRLPFFAGVSDDEAAADAFSGPPPWLSSESFRAPSDASRSMLASALRLSEADLVASCNASRSSAAMTAAGVLWTRLSAVMPAATAAENKISEGATPSTSSVELAKLSARDNWEADVSAAVQAGGDDALESLTQCEAYKATSLVELAKTPEERDNAKALAARRAVEATTGQFVREYFKAYFRAGHIFQAQLKTDDLASAAVTSVIGKLNLKNVTQAQIDAATADIKGKLQDLCKKDGGTDCLLTSALGSDAFVSRSGTTIQFQGVTLAVGYSGGVQGTWDYPKGKDFAPQMVRVLMEASFDSRPPYVPAAATATACKVAGLFPSNRCLSTDLVQNTPGLSDAIAAVDESANRADSATGIATGTLIRSFGIVALNNEAAADTIENLSAAIARKVTERAAWRRMYTQQCTPATVKNATPAALKVAKVL